MLAGKRPVSVALEGAGLPPDVGRSLVREVLSAKNPDPVRAAQALGVCFFDRERHWTPSVRRARFRLATYFIRRPVYEMPSLCMQFVADEGAYAARMRDHWRRIAAKGQPAAALQAAADALQRSDPRLALALGCRLLLRRRTNAATRAMAAETVIIAARALARRCGHSKRTRLLAEIVAASAFTRAEAFGHIALYLAQSFHELGRTDEAVAWYRRCVERERPDSPYKAEAAAALTRLVGGDA